MKVCVTATANNLDAPVDPRFGRCAYFLLIDPDTNEVRLNHANPIVEKTLLIRDRIVHRVANTLHVRGWEYVNYGFLLKGIGMDHGLDGPGLNTNDTWRSEWVDTQISRRRLQSHLSSGT